MARGTSIPIASIVVVMAAVGLVATDRASAAEPDSARIRVISSDATAQFVPLELNKSLVIDLPTDIKDVLVANPSTVNAVVRSRRRVYLVGVARGMTNVYFFDAGGRQIGALDVAVTNRPQPAPSESALPANVIEIYRGTSATALSCTPKTCISVENPEAPDTQHIVNTSTSTNTNINH
jgi:Flp pilus assembly secretin CpaC